MFKSLHICINESQDFPKIPRELMEILIIIIMIVIIIIIIMIIIIINIFIQDYLVSL